MKKIILALLLVLSLCSPVFAADGDIASVTISSDPAENGWVALIGITSASGTPGVGGTYNFGITATSTDLSTARVILTVTSGGFNASGVYSASQTTRTVYGTYWLRKAFPDTLLLTSKVVDEALAAGVLTLKVALSEAIYAGETVTAVISGGASPLYTQGGTPNAAYSGAVTNSSTLAYPPVVARWAKPDYEQITSTSYTLEAVAFHAYGIAAVKFTCTDAHAHTATATATAMTKSGWTSTSGGVTGMDQNAVLVYSGTVDMSSFTAKDPVTCNFVAYPNVGNASVVADSHVYTAAGSVTSGTFVNREVVTQETSGVTAYVIMPVAAAGPIQLFGFSDAASDGELTWTGATSGAVFTQSAAPVAISAPDERLHKLVALYDGAGTYGTPCAIVASTGQASALATWVGADCATARAAYVADNTVSYTTIGYAIQALKAYNNANNGHNDPGGGVVELTAGNYDFDANEPAADTGAQATWMTIRPYDTTARADVIFNSGDYGHKTRFIKVSGVTVSDPDGTVSFGNSTADGMFWLDNSLINFAKTSLILGSGTVYATFNTITACKNGLAQYSTTRTPYALVRGNYYATTAAGAGIKTHLYCMIGNSGLAPRVWFDNGNALNVKSGENAILAYNDHKNNNLTDWLNIAVGSGSTLYNGVAIVQNLVEAATSLATIEVVSSSPATISNNILHFHNTFVGERSNEAYNTVGTASLYRLHHLHKNNIYGIIGTKGDTFADNSCVISAISSAGTGEVTCSTAHGLDAGGETVYFSGVPGDMGTLLNGTFKVATVTSTTKFTIDDTSSAAACASSCGVADTRNGGRKGSWMYEYQVGCQGNYIITAPSATFRQTWDGVYSFFDGGRGASTPGFLYDASQTTGSTGGTGDGNGNGNYQLYSSSSAYNRTRGLVLPYDLRGERRRAEADDAGCYTRGLGKIF